MQVITVLLQVGLPLLEEAFLHLGEILVVIVPIGVGPLEDLSALDDCLTAVLQEVELLRWVTFSLMQQHAFLLDHRQEFDGELAGAVMVGEPLVIPHVALQLGNRFLSLGFFCLEAGILLLFLVQVALVIASGCGAMVLPVTHANPAELVAALRTCHMVASLILLDALIALRAWFRVGRDPVNILRLSARLVIPSLCGGAIARFMRVLATHEAELSATFAGDFVEHAAHVFSLAAILAADVWTPLDVFVVICKTLAQPLPISCLVLG